MVRVGAKSSDAGEGTFRAGARLARVIFPAMRPTFRLRSRFRSLTIAAALVAGASCRERSAETAAGPPPPAADFVLSAGDSAFWVTSAGGTVHVRGAPLELARVDGRFYELYVADDDRSFQDANFIGQRMYRRDLLAGDSVLVYEDTLVPRLAREYARRHPDDAPLGEQDEPSDDPRWSATSTLDLSDVHGPFVSVALHTDVERDDAPHWHTSRRGVIDLRGRGMVSLAAVVGADSALPAIERERAAALQAARERVRASASEDGASAASLLSYYHLDPGGFAITTIDGAPAVAYALSGTGDGDAGHLLPLDPIRIGEPAWWPGVAATLPVSSVGHGRDVWRHGNYEVVVRYDSTSGPARLVLRDSTSREWTIARVPGSAARIFWLDAPAIDSTARAALTRAFDESTLYDDAVRTAALRTHRRPTGLRLAAARRHRPATAPRPRRHSPHA